MALTENFVIILEVLILLSAMITGFVIAITVGITYDHFTKKCPLYGDIAWNNQSNPTDFTIDFGHSSSCHYIVTFQCLLAFFCLIYAAHLVYSFFQTERKLWVAHLTIVNGIFTFMIFIQACVVSIGFRQWCSAITSGPATSSCKGGQKDIKWPAGMDGSSYFNFLTTGQAASWVSFLFFISLVVLGSFLIYQEKRRQSNSSANTPSATNASDTAVITDNEFLPSVI